MNGQPAGGQSGAGTTVGVLLAVAVDDTADVGVVLPASVLVQVALGDATGVLLGVGVIVGVPVDANTSGTRPPV